ncbi:hypothetical protein CSUI_002750 [Cystoisospora suis]|uniref:THIF-type NAD/FAD binding fold domain-containing protein n=1 Tax=Cystoisospora suis TaxID=483139 RepID=A0A2C6KH95_9APIC|nr:hypothetical protein CSUI_002750 [Cystoisospora suis]
MVTDPQGHSSSSGNRSPPDASSPSSACNHTSNDHMPFLKKEERATTDRYDRQIRIWGEHGQDALSRSSVLLLGSSAVAGEVLKNLVLPGIHRFLVVDDAVVKLSDLRNSSFFSKQDVGKLRSEVLAKEVKCLNPDVHSAFLALCPQEYIDLCEGKKKSREDDVPREKAREGGGSSGETWTPSVSTAVYVHPTEGRSSSGPIVADGNLEGRLVKARNGIRLIETPRQFSVVIACQQPFNLLLRLSDLCGLETSYSPSTSPPPTCDSSLASHSRSSSMSPSSRTTSTPPSSRLDCPASASDSSSSSPQGTPALSLSRSLVVPLICVSCVGLLGCVRISAGVRCLVERKAQKNVDLRLFDPFPELYEFAMKYDLDGMDDMSHAQVPFVAILIQVLDRYRKERQGISGICCWGGSSASSQPIHGAGEMASAEGSCGEQALATPLPPEARRQLEAMIEEMRRYPDEVNFDEARANVYRILQPYQPSEEVMQVIEEASQDSFHIPENPGFSYLARALAAFHRASHRLPLQGTVPDMTCDTESFIRMQQLYAKRAEGDCNAIKASVAMLEGIRDDGECKTIQTSPEYTQIEGTSSTNPAASREESLGLAPKTDRSCEVTLAFLTHADVEKFCKNAHDLKIIRYRSLRQELTPSTINRAVFEEAAASLEVEDTDEGISLAPWYVGFWASHRFAEKKGFFPGTRPSGSWPASHHVDGKAGIPDLQGTAEQGRTDGQGDSPVCASRPSSGSRVPPREQERHCAASSTAMCRPLEEDVQDLKEEVRRLVDEIGVPGFVVDEKIIEQIVAFGGSEFPTTAAIVGGVAAQEAVKLVCGQFEPINNTFIWNGVERKSEVYEF